MSENQKTSATLHTVAPVQAAPTSQAWADKVRNLQRRAALETSNTPARDHYGEVLNVTEILFDAPDHPRKITLKNGQTSGDVYKSTFRTLEHGWVDSYTLACHSFAQMVVKALDGHEFPEPIAVVFSGQLTKRHRDTDGLETDTVRLV